MDPQHERYIPRMNTDVTLLSETRCIVMDAKYYRSVFSSRFGQQKLRSGHLYQLYAYMQNRQRSSSVPVEGMLVYPVTETRVDARYVFEWFPVRVTAINLNRPWQDIHRDLLGLLDMRPRERSSTELSQQGVGEAYGDGPALPLASR